MIWWRAAIAWRPSAEPEWYCFRATGAPQREAPGHLGRMHELITPLRAAARRRRRNPCVPRARCARVGGARPSCQGAEPGVGQLRRQQPRGGPRHRVRYGDRPEGLRQPGRRHARPRGCEVAGDRPGQTDRLAVLQLRRAGRVRGALRRVLWHGPVPGAQRALRHRRPRPARDGHQHGARLPRQPGDGRRLLAAVHHARQSQGVGAAAQGHALHQPLHPAQRRPTVHVDRERRA